MDLHEPLPRARRLCRDASLRAIRPNYLSIQISLYVRHRTNLARPPDDDCRELPYQGVGMRSGVTRPSDI
jgi:hypothetical protein